jgi:hypothetical protein
VPVLWVALRSIVFCHDGSFSDSVEEINALGFRYATLPAGADKEEALLGLCRAFHPYLMKYLAMICRGHVPV